jgi:hypothetical protein
VRRQAEHVGRREERRHVVARPEHVDVAAQRRGGGGLLPPREPLIVAGDHERGAGGRCGAPAVEQEVESLARESGADGETHGTVAEAERPADRGAIARAAARMEPLEVDAVVEDPHALGRDPVVADHLVGRAPRHRENVPMSVRREHAPLEVEDRPLIEPAAATSPRRVHGREIALVRAAADPDDVLPRRAPESDHDVERAARREPRRHDGEAHEARPAAGAQDRHAVRDDAGRRRRAVGGEHVQRVTALDEPRRHPAQVGLGAAARQAPMQKRDPHGPPLSSAGGAAATALPAGSGGSAAGACALP